MGAVENQQVSVGNNNTEPIPIQIISYYDELNDFSFDPSTKEMRFTMPFDWNLTRLQENKVIVHQEILVPKTSELVANSYIRTINGIDVTKDLMIDPTDSTKDVVLRIYRYNLQNLLELHYISILALLFSIPQYQKEIQPAKRVLTCLEPLFLNYHENT